MGRNLLGGDDKDSLELYFGIVRSIIEYNDSRIIQILFESEFFEIILELYQRSPGYIQSAVTPPSTSNQN